MTQLGVDISEWNTHLLSGVSRSGAEPQVASRDRPPCPLCVWAPQGEQTLLPQHVKLGRDSRGLCWGQTLGMGQRAEGRGYQVDVDPVL